MGLLYRTDHDIPLDQFIELYRASTLGERRPVDSPAIMADMLRHGNLLITAWEGDLLVGVARSLSDFSHVAYLADLAVRLSHQRRGIGKELIRRTRAEMGSRSTLVLLSAPAAVDYYPKIGFTHHPQAWVMKAGEPLR